MTHPLRFALHLGYRPPFEPLFRATVRNDDPVEHVRFAAERGFAGVLAAAARRYSIEEQVRLGQAIARHGLEAGCLLYTTFDQLRNTSWGRDDASARAWIDQEMAAASLTAQRIGARCLAVLGGADPERDQAAQRETMAMHLRRVAERVAPAGLQLCVETLNAASVPGMLLHHVADAVEVLRRADHPAVRLIFDTAHVQAMDGDVLPWLQQAWPWVEVVQIADHPGRFEPGSGTVDVEGVLDWLRTAGYRGLVELEHGWQTAGIEAENQALRWLAHHGLG